MRKAEVALPAAVPSTVIEAITSPFVRFARMEAASGIVLLAGEAVALVWANSPWEHSYHQILEAQVSIGFGNVVVTEDRHGWINDGLMALFFFLVGLEIKREVLVGELSSLRRAVFPLVAALGGMAVPAVLFLAVTHGANVRSGWAIPISTDIAFALGLLAFLGNRVPVALKVFVTALAIVDDIFAVIIIAVFYTSEINYTSMAIGVAGLCLSVLASALGVRKPAVYALIGVVVWFGVLNSGVHATIAGILLAFTIPARTYLDKPTFLKRSRFLLDKWEEATPHSFEEQTIVQTLEEQLTRVESPLHRIERSLQPWVSFLVVPLFAFANAGVNFGSNFSGAVTSRLALGVAIGLFVGKPLGISLFSWLAVKAGIAVRPAIGWRQIFGAAWLCGIGFTMSLFVATLAFEGGAELEVSKVAILAASVAAGICGSVVLARVARLSGGEVGPE